jgi:hypothetical protein
MLKNDVQELTAKEWISILSQEYPASKERVIIIGNFSRSVRINKEAWKWYFKNFAGIDFKSGEEIEIVPNGAGGPKAQLPGWIRERLAAAPGNIFCIIERDRRYYLKKLLLTERPTQIPVCMVTDSFDKDVVHRIYTNSPDIQQISYPTLEQIFTHTGKFRHDPLVPFKEMNGRIGFLARKEFLGGMTKSDQEQASMYCQQIAQRQSDNGSWDDNIMTTAFNLIKLIEAGATMKDAALEKGSAWLLSTPEPLGFPGLFMLTEKLTTRFNAWKIKQTRGKSNRPHRKTTDNEANKYLQDRDRLSSISAKPCELRLTWTSAIAIEALLRCGLYEESRVVQAINTLMTIGRGWSWCGCGYFDSRNCNYIQASTEPIDFNRFPILNRNLPYSLDWYMTRQRIASLVCNNYDWSALDLGNGKALLVKRFRSTGECSLVVRRALSFHPQYHGSNFETNVALTSTWFQGADGTWGDAYLSTMFGILERTVHPLSALLVLRSIPMLIREQRKDGFWSERPTSSCPPPSKEESSYIILKTLKRFNFLEPLRP